MATKRKPSKKKAGKRDKKPVAATQTPAKGGRSCAVCNHPRRAELDKALALEKMTAAQVAREVGCNRTSVGRHVKNHLLPAVASGPASPEVRPVTAAGDIDILTEVKELYSMIRKQLEAAEKESNWKALRAFHAEARNDLELLGKLVGKLESAPSFNLTISPVWVQVRAVILRALEPFPEARLAVSHALVTVDTIGAEPPAGA